MAPFVGETMREISLKLPLRKRKMRTSSTRQEEEEKREYQREEQEHERERKLCVPLFVWPLNAAIISLKTHSARQLLVANNGKRIRIPQMNWLSQAATATRTTRKRAQGADCAFQKFEVLSEINQSNKTRRSSQRIAYWWASASRYYWL